jgi:hypothetical protein
MLVSCFPVSVGLSGLWFVLGGSRPSGTVHPQRVATREQAISVSVSPGAVTSSGAAGSSGGDTLAHDAPMGCCCE